MSQLFDLVIVDSAGEPAATAACCDGADHAH